MQLHFTIIQPLRICFHQELYCSAIKHVIKATDKADSFDSYRRSSSLIAIDDRLEGDEYHHLIYCSFVSPIEFLTWSPGSVGVQRHGCGYTRCCITKRVCNKRKQKLVRIIFIIIIKCPFSDMWQFRNGSRFCFSFIKINSW